MEENEIDTPTVDMELVSPVRSVTEMEISTPVDKGKGIILYELGYLLEKLEKEQADYIGVPQAGPYKPEHYRY